MTRGRAGRGGRQAGRQSVWMDGGKHSLPCLSGQSPPPRATEPAARSLTRHPPVSLFFLLLLPPPAQPLALRPLAAEPTRSPATHLFPFSSSSSCHRPPSLFCRGDRLIRQVALYARKYGIIFRQRINESPDTDLSERGNPTIFLKLNLLLPFMTDPALAAILFDV